MGLWFLYYVNVNRVDYSLVVAFLTAFMPNSPGLISWFFWMIVDYRGFIAFLLIFQKKKKNLMRLMLVFIIQ